MSSKEAWPISIKELGASTKANIKLIRKTSAIIYYPIFLLYSFTIIGLAKLIQIIF